MDIEEMAQRGAEDAERGEPNPFYYHHYYHYRRGYDQARRRRRQPLLRFAWTLAAVVGILVIVFVGLSSRGVFRSNGPELQAAAPSDVATATPRPLFPTPTPTTPPPTTQPTSQGTALQIEGFAVVSNTSGRTLRAREAPSLSAKVQTSFDEGERVRILEGPVEADGLRWWRVEGVKGNGWSAEQSAEGDIWLQPAP